MKIVIGDRKPENAEAISKTMNEAGFDTVPVEMDLSTRESIVKLIEKAQSFGEVSMLVNAAGVSPSQAPIEAILNDKLLRIQEAMEQELRSITPDDMDADLRRCLEK